MWKYELWIMNDVTSSVCFSETPPHIKNVEPDTSSSATGQMKKDLL